MSDPTPVAAGDAISAGGGFAIHIAADGYGAEPVDYDDPSGALACADQASCTWVTLGDGGSLTLRFIDNVLTGSGDNAFDLWIFEVGADIEDTFVEISADGSSWQSVGKIFGSTAGIDLDAFGFGVGSLFSYVRLTDDRFWGHRAGQPRMTFDAMRGAWRINVLRRPAR